MLVFRAFWVVVGLYQMLSGIYGFALVVWFMPGHFRRLSRGDFFAGFLRALVGRSCGMFAGLCLLGEAPLWLWAVLSVAALSLSYWDARSSGRLFLEGFREQP